MKIDIAKPIRFILVGIANSAVGLSVIFAAKALLGWNDLIANIAGYAVGLAVSFVLNRAWTFGFTGATGSALLRFLCTFAIAYALNLATVFILIDGFGVNAYVAQTAGVFPYAVFFYLASRDFVFKTRSQIIT